MKKTKRKNPLALTVIIIYVIFLSVCCFSFMSAQFYKSVWAEITKTVVLENGEFKQSDAQITVALKAGETAKLGKFKALSHADFSGSEDADEIIAWAEQNPQVNVIYTVVLPDGRSVRSDSTQIDLSSAAKGSAQEYIEKLRRLPAIEELVLGSNTDSQLSHEDIRAFLEAFPEKHFSYNVALGGVNLDLGSNYADLTKLSRHEMDKAPEWLSLMKSLKTIELGDETSCELQFEDIEKLIEVCPQAQINYRFTLYGVSVDLGAESIDINHIPVTDNADAVVSALKCMKNCKRLDMDYCGVDDTRMEEIRNMFPDVDVIWRIWFGKCYSVRTDTERILASRPSVGGMLDNTVGDKLKYCTKIKYLDLGHNDELTDISFVKYMPELEVFIIAINQYITDISPLASCPKLEYLEINSTPVSDISPLASCTSLRHLNIACTQVRDISPIYNCTELERFWIGMYTEVSAEQVEMMQRSVPQCQINTTVEDPHGDYWRWDYYDESMFVYHYVPRYALLREQLGYTYSEYSYYWKDPLCGDPCPPQYVGTSPDGIIEKPAA